ncbi:hypothetical protein PR001_g28873, partial [Phytophthora rubi]
MVKLFCAIVGTAGSAFEVDINQGASVSALKDAIKNKNPATITCDAKDLQLFLAKTADGRWLLEESETAQKLEGGESVPQIMEMIAKNKMLSSWT